MGTTICRIYERTEHGARIIAEIRGSTVTGRKAASIRKLLKIYGFPDAPIEDVVNELLLVSPGMGAAIIPPMNEDTPPKP